MQGFLHELDADNFGCVWPLLQQMTYGIPVPGSVVEQNSPGRVFVDDPEPVSVALACRAKGECFLVGREPHTSVGEWLPEILFETLGMSFSLQPFPASWEASLDDVLGDRMDKGFRKQFVFHPDARKVDWRKEIPEGFRIERIDEALLEKVGIGLGLWKPREKLLTYGFGFAMFQRETLVSKCYTAYTGGGAHDLQINTEDGFEGRGFGTLTASAFVEHCICNDFIPAWSCHSGNRASAAVARKVGFEEIGDMPIYVWRAPK